MSEENTELIIPDDLKTKHQLSGHPIALPTKRMERRNETEMAKALRDIGMMRVGADQIRALKTVGREAGLAGIVKLTTGSGVITLQASVGAAVGLNNRLQALIENPDSDPQEIASLAKTMASLNGSVARLMKATKDVQGRQIEMREPDTPKHPSFIPGAVVQQVQNQVNNFSVANGPPKE